MPDITDDDKGRRGLICLKPEHIIFRLPLRVDHQRVPTFSDRGLAQLLRLQAG